MTVGGCGVSTTPHHDELKINIEKGGSLLSSGDVASYYAASYDFKITGWVVSGDTTGSIVIDIRRAHEAVPGALDTITGSNKPTLTAQQYNSSDDVTTWENRIYDGDVLSVSIESVTGLRNVVVTLQIIRC